MWKDLLIFYLTSFVFGGAAFALIYVVKPQELLKNNGLILNSKSLSEPGRRKTIGSCSFIAGGCNRHLCSEP